MSMKIDHLGQRDKPCQDGHLGRFVALDPRRRLYGRDIADGEIMPDGFVEALGHQHVSVPDRL